MSHKSQTLWFAILFVLVGGLLGACSSSSQPKPPSLQGERCYTEGELRCNGDWVQICDSGIWADLKDCRKGNRICVQGKCVEPSADADAEVDLEEELEPVHDQEPEFAPEAELDQDQEAEADLDQQDSAVELDELDSDLPDSAQEEDKEPEIDAHEEHGSDEVESEPDPEPEIEPEPEEEPVFEPECTSNDECNDNNQCTDDYCVGGFCQYVNHLGGCEDGNPCTIGDFCSNGHCVSGVERNCSDSLECTNDWCDPDTGQCKNELRPGFCLISNQCVPEGTIDPNNPCQKCDPSVRTDYYTPDNSLSCDDGLPCTTNQCSDGFCITLSIARGWCLIDNTCYQEGTQMPGVSCARCVANIEQRNWTVDDGWCVINGQCVEEGTHKGSTGDDWCLECTPANRWGWTELGTNMPCDDGLECTQLDHCDGAGHCTYTSVEQGWCVVNGQCTQDCK